MASHFNTALEFVTNIAKTYGVPVPTISNAIPGETKITQAQYAYENMLQKIQKVMEVVRDYAPYDSNKTALKFNSGNNIITEFTTYPEYVRATETQTGWTTSNPNGRNYMKIIFTNGNKLQ